MNDTKTDMLDQGFAPDSLGEAGSMLSTPAQGVVVPAGQKRLKTWGEKLFDWKTYAGVALIGNEAASLVITTQAEHGIGKQWHKRQMDYFKTLEGKPFVPDYVSKGHLFKILIAVIGGMTVVPFVKYLEDHKGEIVRKSDRKHYGSQADTDPAIIAAHKEMDEAPKQTWGSLWKGRVLTVFAAIGLDWLVGCKDAQSNKLFKDSPTFQKFANMDRLAEHTSNRIMDTFKIAEASRPTWDKWLKQGSWLLVFSSTLTVLFYASSKIFATRREEKQERRDVAIKNGTVLRDGEEALAVETKAAEPEAAKREQPSAHISNIAHEATLANAPQLMHSV